MNLSREFTKYDKWQKARILHITELQYGHECKIKISVFMPAIFPPQQVQVGDIVKVVNGQFFPADLIILSSR